MKVSLAEAIRANVVDFDMHNLFEPRPLLEEMADAASGAYENMPRRTLRYRHYGPQPLMIKPKYEGDFLEKLKEKAKRIYGRFMEAASSENLLDFSMPSEWLKHQEQPHPRDLRDYFYEFDRPGDWVGMKTLRDYYDRGWDDTDSPEMSEDKLMRMYKSPLPKRKPVKDVFRASSVIANWLLDNYPRDLYLDMRNSRVAKMLRELENSMIYTKQKGWRKPDSNGVTVRLKRAEPRVGRWTFYTTSGRDTYNTVFQFVPSGTTRDTDKLHVRVSCSCPSWLFWGAQYNAVMQDYLYGKIRPKFVPPVDRDPWNRFLVCKHVLACIPVVSRYRLAPISEDVRKRIQREPKIKVVKGPEEKVRIPEYLKFVEEKPEIKDAVEKWDTWSRGKRKKFIEDLEKVDDVNFMAHRFPETATQFVVKKLKDIYRTGKSEEKKKAQEALKVIT